MKIDIQADNFTFSQQITEEEKRYIVLYLMRNTNTGIKALAKEFVAEQEFKASAIKEANKQVDGLKKVPVQKTSPFPFVAKNCLFCGQLMAKKPTESKSYYANVRKYCDNSCSRKHSLAKMENLATYKKDYVKSERQQKVENSQKAFNDHIESSVIMCANINCHDRLVKGIGVMYKEQEYHSNACLESFLNDPEVSVNGISI